MEKEEDSKKLKIFNGKRVRTHWDEEKEKNNLRNKLSFTNFNLYLKNPS